MQRIILVTKTWSEVEGHKQSCVKIDELVETWNRYTNTYLSVYFSFAVCSFKNV